MTQEEIEENKIIKLLYSHLDDFKDAYCGDKYIVPSNERITVFCKSDNEEGFLINMMERDMGLTALIIKKWIPHTVLESICGRKII